MQDAEDLVSAQQMPSPTGRREAPAKVHRFVASERLLHWALAIPYVLLYASAAVLLVFWSEAQPRHIRTAFSLAHRIAGICLIVVPPLVLMLKLRDWRVHLSNLKEGWVWDRNDFRWLLLAPKAAIHHRIALPEQGKFNAAEKLNFMMVCLTYPLYIATGLLIWMAHAAFLSWILHFAMAILALPLVAGHVFMAAINPSTRIGLEGMITGWVDREWAKHHYRRWFREHFERGAPDGVPRGVASLLKMPARVRCNSCREVHSFESWEYIMQRIFQVEPLFCPGCENEIIIVLAEAETEVAHAILRHLEQGPPDAPFESAAKVA